MSIFYTETWLWYKIFTLKFLLIILLILQGYTISYRVFFFRLYTPALHYITQEKFHSISILGKLLNLNFKYFLYKIYITRGLISSVTDFLAFIPPNVIVSIILAFNKFRLSINFPSVIWWFYDILLIFVSFVQFWAFNISSSLTIKHSFIHSYFLLHWN